MAEKSDVKVTHPKRLSVDQTEEGLIEIHVQIKHRKIVICEADFHANHKRGLLLADLYDEFDGLDKDQNKGQDKGQDKGQSESAFAENILVNVWAPLYACSRGDVPERDQFLKMSEVDIDFWVDIARELNPSWFLWLDAVLKTAKETVEQAKKKAATKVK